MEWTIDQRRAIEEEGDLLVSAAAGSGKTAVLTERIVRLICAGAGVGEFLCVTFTKAAAAEMKKRIERRLRKAAEEAEDAALSQRLHAAAQEASRANISTLHAFCSQVLKRHFHEAGLDPAFRIADDAETLVMKAEAWDEVAEHRYESTDGRFAALMEALGGNESDAMKAIIDLYDFANAQLEPLPWLAGAVAAYNTDAAALEASPAVQELLRYDRQNLAAETEKLARVRDLVAEEYPKLAAHLDECTLIARGILLNESYASYAAALAGHEEFGRISWRGVDDATQDYVKKARESFKDCIKKQERQYARKLDAEAELLARQAGHMQELYQTVAEFHERYAAHKAEQAVIDYSDMEHMVLRLFEDARIAGEYRRRFRYVFMDEYQDANPVQERIIAAVRRPGGLFLVGDVKQSIYRFRMAEPALFIERYARYRAGEGGTAIDLNANFRSAGAVVEAINGIFSRIMTAEAAEIEYDSAAALVHGRDDGGMEGAVEYHLIDIGGTLPQPAGEDEDGEEEGASAGKQLGAAALEAALAAERIHALMATETVQGSDGKPRPLRFCDFAILLRSPKPVVNVWTETLAFSGVPAYAEMTGGFFDAVEVQVFLSLLQAIDNRRNDIPLAAVLRSPIGGFTTEELAVLRAEYGKEAGGAMLACIDSLRLAADVGDPLGEKARLMLARLDRWQTYARLVSVEELCTMLLDETGYAQFCRALPDGKQRTANLEALIERARVYEKSGVRGLSAFLSLMEKAKNTGNLGAAETAGADVVRVMSAHKSKGLEFPVVILGGIGKGFNKEDSRKLLIADGQLGLGARLIEGGLRKENLYTRAIAARASAKNVAEEMRVLYVAMTRAKDRLILLDAEKDAASAVFAAALPLSPAQVALSQNYTAWILGALLQTADGNPLRLRAGILHRADAPSIRVSAELRPAAGGTLLERSLPQKEYERFVHAARQEEGAYAPLLSWRYPHEADTTLPSKVSVTGLAGHEITMAEAPDFIERARMNAADRGTAAHAAMQHITLAMHTEQSVRRELAALTAAGLLEPAQAEAVDAAAIVRFFADPLGRRLLASDEVRRELEFNYRVSARRLLGADTDEPVLLQGVIDCCFREGDAWVVVDYKTDFVPPGVSPEAAAAKHARQLALYCEALSALTRAPVKEAYIHLLRIGESVRLVGG